MSLSSPPARRRRAWWLSWRKPVTRVSSLQAEADAKSTFETLNATWILQSEGAIWVSRLL